MTKTAQLSLQVVSLLPSFWWLTPIKSHIALKLLKPSNLAVINGVRGKFRDDQNYLRLGDVNIFIIQVCSRVMICKSNFDKILLK